MVKNRQIIVVIIAVTVGALLLQPFASAIADGTGEQSVQNETFSAELDTQIDLSWSNIVNDTETVEYDDGTSWQTVDSSNYTMDYEAGEINISSSSQVTAGDDVRISYDYTVTDQQTTTVLQLAPLLLALLLLVVLASRVMDMM